MKLTEHERRSLAELVGDPEVLVKTGAYPTPQTPCTLTKRHSPANLTLEFHHIVPVAWQLFWQPVTTVAPFPGPDPDGRGMLWDNRGIWLCPTHHRNVHANIVALMHAKKPLSVVEMSTALLAVTRYQAVGGDISMLTKAGEWGES